MTWKRSELSRHRSWTKAEIHRARRTPLPPILESQGYRLEPRARGNYRVVGLTQEIIVKDHYWVCTDDASAAPDDHSRSGNSIDFLVQIGGLSFEKAMELLTS